MVAVLTVHSYSTDSALFQMPTETQALAELSKSDKMLASAAAPISAPKLQSAAVLKKAADMLVQKQEEKITKAAAKLQGRGH